MSHHQSEADLDVFDLDVLGQIASLQFRIASLRDALRRWRGLQSPVVHFGCPLGSPKEARELVAALCAERDGIIAALTCDARFELRHAFDWALGSADIRTPLSSCVEG
ncbi:hypothetical protein [Rhodopila sp.]|uniref:hypothetical protein n=1 Tax=Rhodopila sp. TaxID=2480087 RepID=UPI002D81015B|nr:hypothetical protein [Rhodopila sp.]